MGKIRTKMDTYRNTARCVTALLAGVMCLVCLVSCGKEGMPTPKKTQDVFTFAAVRAKGTTNCLIVSGTVVGAVHNVADIAIEVAPIESYGDCPGCPFAAHERREFSPKEAQLDLTTGEFFFSFCPVSDAPMYRWQVVGTNTRIGLPPTTNPPQVTIVRSEH